jgi:hypothetical protein
VFQFEPAFRTEVGSSIIHSGHHSLISLWQPVATKLQKIRKAASAATYLFDFESGPEGVRTPDLMTASHARSQLRHRPEKTYSS